MLFALALTAMLAGQTGLFAANASVGSPAPKLEPKEWLNSKDSVSWDKLKGRVILVEKWATW
jgi:hypothetical protein